MATAASTNGVTALPPLVPLDSNYESAVAFSSYANWLLPGRVMLGRYPHVEPSRCRTRDQGEAQLDAILRAGITTFVSLQEELPPQEQLKIAGKNGFLPYKATAELIHAALQPPPPLEDLHALRNPALNKFLPPKHAKGGSGAAGQQAPQPLAPKLVFLHSPIPDLGVPSSEGLRALVDDLAARVRGGQEVLYVHCWGGRGRAGTVGACLVACLYNLTAEESLQRVQRAFDTRRDSERRSPETDEQVQFVQQFISARR